MKGIRNPKPKKYLNKIEIVPTQKFNFKSKIEQTTSI